MNALLIVLGPIAYVAVGYFVARWAQVASTTAVVAVSNAYYRAHLDRFETLRREMWPVGLVIGALWPIGGPSMWLVMHIVYRPQIREAEAEKEWRP